MKRSPKKRPQKLTCAESLDARVLFSSYSLNTIASFNPYPQGEHPLFGLISDNKGNLYGTTNARGSNGGGTVFKIASGTGSLTMLGSFPSEPLTPTNTGVTLDSSGDLYGTTYQGGAKGQGTVFEVVAGTSSITTIASFTYATNGGNPNAPVTIDAAGNIYGTTEEGGANGVGTIFKVAAGSSSIVTLASFNSGTVQSYIGGGLILDGRGDLFGTTNHGTIVELASGSSTLTTLASFSGSTGDFLVGGLTRDAAGNLYGTTTEGGTSNQGTIFKLASGSTSITTLASLTGVYASSPQSTLVLDYRGNLYGTAETGTYPNAGAVFELASGSSTVTLLTTFAGPNGANPAGELVLDSGGNLYGTTSNGGAENLGEVFKLASGSSNVTILRSFVSSQGSIPARRVTLDSSGNLYGTTIEGGGGNNSGSAFEIASGSKSISTIVTYPTGSYPAVGLTVDASGNLYGTDYDTGANGDGYVYKIASGTSSITTIASFNGANGALPDDNVTIDARGNLYGTTSSGGADDAGAVFEIASGSTSIHLLASFDGSVDSQPVAAVVLDAQGNIYGTADRIAGDSFTQYTGAIFELASGSSSITTLADFVPATTGYSQTSQLFRDSHGNLFGTTSEGGAGGEGAIFELASGSSSIAVLTTPADATNAGPVSGLTADASGNLYGIIAGAGASGTATLFEIPSGTSSVVTVFTFPAGIGPYGNVAIDAAGDIFGVGGGGSAGAGTVYELTPVVPPTVTLNTPAANSSTNATPTFSGVAGTASEDATQVVVKIYSGSAATGTPVETLTTTVNPSTGAYSAVSSALPIGTYSAQATQADSLGGFGASTVNTFSVVAAPDVQSFTVDNGSAQRSNVRTLTVTFTQPVLLDGAFALSKISGNNSTSIGVTASTSDGGTTYVITPTSGTTGGSLSDGNYHLVVHSAGVFSKSNPSITMSGSDRTYTFFRLFGDSNGDGTVNLIDYRAFAISYLKSTGSAGYNSAFDSNNDGTINLLDYRAFAANYLKVITG